MEAPLDDWMQPMDLAQIQLLDDLSTRAVPPEQLQEIDGWLARRSSRIATRRANSVLARRDGDLAPERRIEQVERFYAEAGQAPLFQLTPAARPDGLRAMLLARGYTAAEPTAVQTVSLADEVSPPGADVLIQLTPEPTAQWWAAWRAALSVEPGRSAAVEELFARIEPPCAFAAVSAAGQLLGVGMGVLDTGRLGIFNMSTVPIHRRRGAASAALSALLAWARDRGATSAYLQVATANTAALGLYGRHGFREAYRYEYLTGPTRGEDDDGDAHHR